VRPDALEARFHRVWLRSDADNQSWIAASVARPGLRTGPRPGWRALVGGMLSV
jgi:hypothetical protein